MRPASRQHWILLLAFAATTAAFVHQVASRASSGAPDFGSLPAGKPRKAAFFAYLRPLVAQENARIAEERRELLVIADQLPDLGWFDRYRLRALAAEYLSDPDGLDDAETVQALLPRVDELPESLVLAQAAKESGWGTARFSVHGNNYFGQRCWDPGCGMVPNARAPGKRHEVATYESAQESVASYLHNLNTHDDYEALRERRVELRAAGRSPRGVPLAECLPRYSERRRAYVDEIQSLIDFNELENDS